MEDKREGGRRVMELHDRDTQGEREKRKKKDEVPGVMRNDGGSSAFVGTIPLCIDQD